MKKWINYEFESSCSKTPEFVAFARDFKRFVKKALPYGAELVKWNVGHFYVSGFVKKNDKYVYFETSDVRFFPNTWFTNLLIRTAQHVKDYTGGANTYTALDEFAVNAENLFSR